jgi:hypothetical protein
VKREAKTSQSNHEEFHYEYRRFAVCPGALKERYREAPEALITLRAQGRIGEGVSCKIETGKALSLRLHPHRRQRTAACSGDMLLRGSGGLRWRTLNAVATSLGIELETPRSWRR